MTWYEDSEQFTVSGAYPAVLEHLAGPRGVALVDVYNQGRTTPGWGLLDSRGEPAFMPNYLGMRFWAKPRRLAFVRHDRPFAFITRALRVLVLDIDRHLDDGGADGFVAARGLQLPPTLAQTSKSGEGRHLFYAVEDTWDNELGFARWDDVVGLVPGVDVRAVGCIYRHPQQRWNTLPLAPLPDNVRQLLEARRAKKTALQTQLAAAAAADPNDEEAMIMHDALLRELNKPIQPGKRNISLFAIGSQMKDAGYPNWENEITRRADEVGLDQVEAAKLVGNIGRYSA